MNTLRQGELDFAAPRSSGLHAWRAEQERQRQELARTLRLPLGKQVEVWLQGGVRLRGPLQLEEPALFCGQSTLQNTRFEVNGVPFFYAELESCVALSAAASG